MDSKPQKEPADASEKTSAPEAPGSFVAMAQSMQADLLAQSQLQSDSSHLFAEAFSFEMNRSLRGVAQTAGAESYVPAQAEPVEAPDSYGQHAQMLGRAIGGVLPAIAVGALTRYGFGKVLAHDGAAAEHALLKRSGMGLSVAESGTTGFVFGSVFTPTENASNLDFGTVVGDRIKSGTSSMLAFSLMSASSLGLSKIASTEIGVALKADKIMKSGTLNGIISGIPSGLANVEADSIVRHGQLDFDGERIGKSVYEMAIFGGTFGLGTTALKRIRTQDSPRIVQGSETGEIGFVRSGVDNAKQVTSVPITQLGLSDASIVETLGRGLSEVSRQPAAEPSETSYIQSTVELQQHPRETAEASRIETSNEWPQTAAENSNATRGERSEKSPQNAEEIKVLTEDEARTGLKQHFSPETLQLILQHDSAQSSVPHSLHKLLAFVEQDPARRIPIVETLVSNEAPRVGSLSTPRLEAIDKLSKWFFPSTVDQLVMKDRYSDSSFTVSGLATYVEGNPDKRVPLVERMVFDNTESSALIGERLQAFETLGQYFGKETIVTLRLGKMADNGLNLHELVKFIEVDPARRAAEINRIVITKNSIIDLKQLSAIDELEHSFGKDSPALKKIFYQLAYINTDRLQSVSDFVKMDPKKNAPWVEQLFEGGMDVTNLSGQKLTGIAKLNAIYGEGSETVKRLLEIDNQDWLSLHSLAEYIETDPAKRKDRIAGMVANNDSPGEFEINRLTAIEKLHDMFAQDPATFSQLMKYDSGGGVLNVIDLSRFVSEDPQPRVELVTRLVQSASDSSPRLDRYHLEAMEQLQEIFGKSSPVVSKVQNSKSDLSNLLSFVKEDPKHQQLVDAVAENKSSDAFFNTESLINLSHVLDHLDDPAMKQRLTRAYDGFFPSQHLLEFMYSDEGAPDAAHMQLVQQLVDQGAPLSLLRLKNLKGYEALSTEFPLGSPEMNRLMELNREGLDLAALAENKKWEPEKYHATMGLLLGDRRNIAEQFADLSSVASFANELKFFTPESTEHLFQFISENPSERIPLLEANLQTINQQIVRPNHGFKIDPERLSSLEFLNQTFGADSKVMEVLQRQEGTYASLTDITDFIKMNPDLNKSIVERISLDLTDRTQLEKGSLDAVENLSKSFGPDSEAMNTLLRYERELGFDLVALNRYLEQYPSRATWVEYNAAEHTSSELLDGNRLISLEKLIALFGEPSAPMQKIRELESEGRLFPPAVAEFIEHDPNREFEEPSDSRNAEERNLDIQKRKEFIEHLINSNANTQETWLIESQFNVERYLGRDSAAMQRLLQFDENRPVHLATVKEFLDSNPKTAIPFIEKFARVATTADDFSSLDAVKQLDDLLKPDDAQLAKLLDLTKNRAQFHELTSFVEQDPEANRSLALKLMEVQKDYRLPRLDQLQGWKQLQDVLGADSPLFEKLLASDRLFDPIDMALYAKEEAPASLMAIEKASESTEDSWPRSVDTAIYKVKRQLSKTFVDDPETLKRLMDMEHSGADLRSMFSVISRDGVGGAELLKRMIAEGAPANKFYRQYLFARSTLDHAFGVNSKRTENILSYSQDRNYLYEVNEYLRSQPKAQDAAKIVETLIEQKLDPAKFNCGALYALQRLQEYFKGDTPILRRLAELTDSSADLSQLDKFIYESPSAHVQLVRDQLQKHNDATALNVARLREQDLLNKLALRFPFDSNVPTALQRMFDANELSGSRVANYVGENPDLRTAEISKLIGDGADAKRLNDVMSLSMFPSEAANNLAVAARNGGMSVAGILGNLRLLQSGQNFYNLVLESASTGKSLQYGEMQKLAEEAKSMPRTHEPIAEQALPGWETTHESRELAEIHKMASEKILEAVPADKSIVVLGRDMWTFLPLLRRNRDVQYFLWSRAQVPNGQTEQQWLREVPPNSVVIDTGYSGSIIDKIRNVDSGASGYLLSSTGKYAQLLDNPVHSEMAGQIETVPKLIGSSKSYTGLGNAVSKSDARDEYDVAKLRVHPQAHDRWGYEREVKSMFRAMGLAPWDTWRYTQFVGLTPKERLGLNTDAGVQAHYERIQQLRAQASAVEAPDSVAQEVAN